MLNITNEIKFFQDIHAGNYQAVLEEITYYPIMIDIFSSPACALATPIMVAAHSGQSAIFDLLKQRGANLNRLDAMGWNLLMHAVASQNEEIVQKVMGSYNTAELACALVHKNAEGVNTLEFALKHCPGMLDILVGKKPTPSTLDLPSGTDSKNKSNELKGSLALAEEEFFEALNEFTASATNPAEDFAKFLNNLLANKLEDEPELVDIINARNSRNMNKQSEEKRSHETEVVQDSQTLKVRILPVTQPLLLQLQNHNKLVSTIEARVEQVRQNSTEKSQFPSTPS